MTAPYEFVCDDSDPMWLEHRRSMITGTVAPQLLGLNRFGSLLETYAEMRMGVTADDADEDARIRMDWGSDQQDAVVLNLQRRLGLAARRTGALLRSTRYPWLGATLDAWVVADERVPIQCPAGTQLPFEVKTTRSRHAAEEWEDDVPPDVRAQVQTQIIVTGAPGALVGAVVFGAPPAFAWLERDDAMCDRIIDESKKFYDRVQRGDPPPPSGAPDDAQALERIAGQREGATELDIEAVRLVEELGVYEGEAARIKTEIDRRKQLLIRALGSAEEGLLPGGGALTYRAQTRRGGVQIPGEERLDAVRSALADAGWAADELARVRAQPATTFRVLRRRAKG